MRYGRSIGAAAVLTVLLAGCSSGTGRPGDGPTTFHVSGGPVTISAGPSDGSGFATVIRPGTVPTASGTGSGSSAAGGTASGGPPLGANELQGRWWTWVATLPAAANPLLDPDGHLCGVGQVPGVWFLAGTKRGAANRSCTMPAGVRVAFPVLNVLAVPSICDRFAAKASGSATLDGKPLAVQLLRGSAVSLTVVAGSPVSDRPGTVNGLACGLWVQHEGLTPGRHTLVFHGSVDNYVVAVTYRLDVRAR